ncbi:MAG TPA: DUF896 domain-containing protein [Peptococcaceae bacterium]|nr:DUF896 domain-containing protein [Peptococcaceae bacterium]
MDHQQRIARINELARKSRSEGLTPEEAAEQHKLRQEYLAIFRQNFRQQLEAIRFSDHHHDHHHGCSCGHSHHKCDCGGHHHDDNC